MALNVEDLRRLAENAIPDSRGWSNSFQYCTCWEYSSRLISSSRPQISQQDQTDWTKLRFYVLWVLFIGSTSSTMTSFGLWDSTKSCIVCVGLMYDEPLLIYEVFIWMSVSIFIELTRTLQRGASLTPVQCRTEKSLVLKCYCTHKKVRPLYIWTRVIVSSIVFLVFLWCLLLCCLQF